MEKPYKLMWIVDNRHLAFDNYFKSLGTDGIFGKIQIISYNWMKSIDYNKSQKSVDIQFIPTTRQGNWYNDSISRYWI